MEVAYQAIIGALHPIKTRESVVANAHRIPLQVASKLTTLMEVRHKAAPTE